MLLAGALAMSLLLLLMVEGFLRLTGLGAPDAAHASRLKYQQIYLPILAPGERADGTPILQIADTRLPYQSILAQKPRNGLRVFTFGGSAAAGLGFSPNVTFARHLERMLEAAYPERQVEVMNLGIVAIAARQVEVLVRHVCESYEPDVMIVYSGNNEFLEVHAEKYAAAHANLFSSLRDRLLQTHLYRLVDRLLRGPPRAPSLAEQDFSADDLRMTQDELIQSVEMAPEEIREITADYGETMRRIAGAASAAQVPVVLMTVASNWKWRGREDLPDSWLDEVVPPDGRPRAERQRAALDVLAERIDAAAPDEVSPLRFERAVAAESVGDYALARDEYRAAMNSDPHLRRALDAMAEEVRGAAREREAALVDVIAVLERQAKHGIVGHDEFYDYVHLTPRGAVRVAEALFRKLVAAGILPETGFDPGAYARARLALEASLDEDLLPVREWLGFGFDPAGIHDRDLWKYDRFVASLDERLEEHPADFRARVYRANAYAWKLAGAEQAARDYRAALERAPSEGEARAVRQNLDWLEADRR